MRACASRKGLARRNRQDADTKRFTRFRFTYHLRYANSSEDTIRRGTAANDDLGKSETGVCVRLRQLGKSQINSSTFQLDKGVRVTTKILEGTCIGTKGCGRIHPHRSM